MRNLAVKAGSDKLLDTSDSKVMPGAISIIEQTVVALLIAGIILLVGLGLDSKPELVLVADTPEYLQSLNVTDSQKTELHTRLDCNRWVGERNFVQIDSVLAAGLQRADFPGDYRPDFRQTTVLVVDPQRAEVTRFSDLNNVDLPVFFTTDGYLKHHMVSWAYAKAGRGSVPTMSHLLVVTDDLAAKHNLGTVIFDEDYTAFVDYFYRVPVAVMTDVQAVRLLRKGLDAKIVVPRDGTLSLGEGIYSQPGLTPPDVDRSALAEAGFRLEPSRLSSEAESRATEFPSEISYVHATLVEDQDWYSSLVVQARAKWRRNVVHVSWFSPTSAMEYDLVYLFLMLGIVTWGGITLWRIPTARLRELFAWLVMLLCGYVFLKQIKFISGPIGSEYLWYGFYFFLLSLVVVLNAIAEETVAIAEPDRRRYWPVNLGVSAVFLLLVLTNGFHNWVFILPDSNRSGEPHDYGPVFVMMIFWLLGWFLYALILLITQAGLVRNWVAVITGSAVVAFIMLVLLLHALRIPPFASGVQVVFLQCVMIVICCETLIQSGLIPSNSRYLKLFSRTTIPVYLLNRRWRVVEHSSMATRIPERVLAKLQSGVEKVECPPRIYASTILNQPRDSYTDYHLLSLPGGAVVLEMDMSAVQVLRETLERNRAKLRTRLIVRHRAAEVALSNEQKKATVKLYELVDGVMRRRLEQVRELLPQVRLAAAVASGGEEAKYHSNQDRGAKMSPVEDAIPDHLELLRIIGLHLGYCKRSGLEMLSGEEEYHAHCSSAHLQQMLAQAVMDFSRRGNEAQVLVQGDTNIFTECSIQVLDAFHTLLIEAVRARVSGVFVQVRVSENSWQISSLWGEVSGADLSWQNRLVESGRNLVGTTDQNQDSVIIRWEDPDWRIIWRGRVDA